MLSATLTCLALNIYWEARNQPVLGQVAVAQIVLNRVRSERFPDDVCAVVKQGGTRLNRCQFSWYCDGKPDIPTNIKAWEQAIILAKAVSEGAVHPPLDRALWYHADYVFPDWANDYYAVAWIGSHIFYQKEPLKGE